MKYLTLIAVAAATAACGSSHTKTNAGAPPPPAVAVTLATVEARDLPESLEVGGTVRAQTVAVLTSRIIGQVQEVSAQPGQRVRRGTVLAILDAREMGAQRERADAHSSSATQNLAAAKAESAAAAAGLQLAQATHARIARLRERNSATPQELDEAQAALSGAAARAAAAEARVSAAGSDVTGARAAAQAAQVASGYGRIVAPFDGVVTQRHLDPGAMTMPGTAVVTVEKSGGHEVEVRLDERRAARVNWSAAPRVTLQDVSGGERVVQGTVTERALALDAAHTVVVKVALPAGEAVRSGMFARVTFDGPARRSLAVPSDAVVQRGALDAVFTDDGGVARYRVVEVGARADDMIEVRAGLHAGERVVRSAPPSLVDGTPIAGGRR